MLRASATRRLEFPSERSDLLDHALEALVSVTTIPSSPRHFEYT